MAAVDPEEPVSNGNSFQLAQRDDDYRKKILSLRGNSRYILLGRKFE